MALDERYALLIAYNQQFVDKVTGEALAGGTVAFYRDTSRGVAKNVFKIGGTPPNYNYTSLGPVLTLSDAGTIIDDDNNQVALYGYPYDSAGELDLYYMVVRDSDGVLQWTREGIPNWTAATDPTSETFPVQNQVANPQFTEQFLNEGFDTTITVNAVSDQVYPVAPGWDLVVSAAAAATMTIRRYAIAGSSAIPTNPPYVFDLNIGSGFSKVHLRQRTLKNSGLWTSTVTNSVSKDVYLSGSFTAQEQDGITRQLSLYYQESNGVNNTTPILVAQGAVTNDEYIEFNGVSDDAVPTSTNSHTGDSGYVDIYLEFASPSHIRVSSIQMLPTLSQAGGDFLEYDRNSSDREQALMGSFYLPQMSKRPLKSYLTGWDFPLNPSQFQDITTTKNVTTTAAYFIDQTICQSKVGNIACVRNGTGDQNTYGLKFTTANNLEALLMLQYLTGQEVKDLLANKLAVNVNAFKIGSNDVRVRVYLLAGNASSTFETLDDGDTVVATWSADGTITTLASNWEEIPRSNLDTAKATVAELSVASDVNSENFDYQFSQWEMTDDTDIASFTNFAIAVTFEIPTNATVFTVNSISLVPGQVATRPAPQTASEVFMECMQYYQKSYPPGTAAGTASIDTGYAHGYANNNSPSGNTRTFDLFCDHSFVVPMRIKPTMSIWDRAATTGSDADPDVAGHAFVNFMGDPSALANFPGTAASPVVSGAGATSMLITTQDDVSRTHFGKFTITQLKPGGESFTSFTCDYCLFHWEAEARLGK